MAGEPRRLYRSRDDRMLGGVCGGIADYFGVDSTLVRLIWVVVALLPGNLGVIGYLIALFVMPVEPEPDERDVELLEEPMDVDAWADRQDDWMADEVMASRTR